MDTIRNDYPTIENETMVNPASDNINTAICTTVGVPL